MRLRNCIYVNIIEYRIHIGLPCCYPRLCVYIYIYFGLLLPQKNPYAKTFLRGLSSAFPSGSDTRHSPWRLLLWQQDLGQHACPPQTATRPAHPALLPLKDRHIRLRSAGSASADAHRIFSSVAATQSANTCCSLDRGISSLGRVFFCGGESTQTTSASDRFWPHLFHNAGNVCNMMDFCSVIFPSCI